MDFHDLDGETQRPNAHLEAAVSNNFKRETSKQQWHTNTNGNYIYKL